uniref:Glyoxylate reductase n=1 Tax=Anthurium amnicola TaxID=1678845 RepID=A0A1D1XYF7_9ARAE
MLVTAAAWRRFRSGKGRALLASLESAARRVHSAGCAKRAEKMVDNHQNSITRVLFCGPHFPASHNYTREYVAHLPYIQVDEAPLEAVPDVICDYHICVVKNRRLDSQVIARANQMKLIMQFGVGLEGVDVDAATRHGIKVARIPGNMTGNSASCAEMAIYLMLGLLRKQKEMEFAVSQKRLGEPVGETLLGKTVFIFGFGAIGVDLARRLQPFGVQVLAIKRKWGTEMPKPNDLESDRIVGLVDEKGGLNKLYDFAAKADIVVTCLTLNAETAGIVDMKFLSSMKKGALLVNVARGGLLDYKSVISHLESGHLGGLGIDVAWTEPFDPEDRILKFPNVLITPHVAGVTEHSYRTMAKVVGDCALQLHTGAPLTGLEFVN